MKTFFIISVSIVILMLPNFAISAEFSPETHFYQTEYIKPQKGSLAVMTVIFSSPISAKHAEEFLREEIKQAVKYSTPQKDIMASAWVQENNKNPEERIKLADGSDFLIYMAKTRKVLTGKAYYSLTMPIAKPGKGINAVINLELQMNSKGGIQIIGKTNLPDEMNLLVDLRKPSINYFAQDKVTIKNGAFETSWFSNRGSGLPKGDYQISITSPLVDLQPESVKTILGAKGENLNGDFVTTSLGQKVIDWQTTKSVK